MKQFNYYYGVAIMTRNIRNLAAAMLLATIGMSAVSASPLDATWTQVGLMQDDGNMFDGNCNLDLSGGCTFNNGGDFWNAFPGADEILFITGDGLYWGQANYADVWGLIQAEAGDFSPNLTWIDAGRNGVSVGSIIGNILQRPGVPEDPWVTLEGIHCQNLDPPSFNCDEMLWGENAFNGAEHEQLMMTHQGVEVYARNTSVPEPTTLALLGLGLFGLGFNRRRVQS